MPLEVGMTDPGTHPLPGSLGSRSRSPSPTAPQRQAGFLLEHPLRHIKKKVNKLCLGGWDWKRVSTQEEEI